MKLAEVQRRVRALRAYAVAAECGSISQMVEALIECRVFYRDTLRALLDHDISDDARQLIEAALEAER